MIHDGVARPLQTQRQTRTRSSTDNKARFCIIIVKGDSDMIMRSCYALNWRLISAEFLDVLFLGPRASTNKWPSKWQWAEEGNNSTTIDHSWRWRKTFSPSANDSLISFAQPVQRRNATDVKRTRPDTINPRLFSPGTRYYPIAVKIP